VLGTPFNIGRGVGLSDFFEASAQRFADGFALPADECRELLHRIFQWTAGHPYLTQRLAMAAAQETRAAQNDLEGLVRRTFLVSGDNKDSNLEWVRHMLTDRAPDRETVLTTWLEILRGRRVMDEEASVAKSHLKATGVVRAADGLLKPRNRIYTAAFDKAWVLRHLPRDLVRQQRLERFRKRFLPALVTVLVLATVAMTLLARHARQAEVEAAAAKAAAVHERDNARIAEEQAVKEQKLTEDALREANAQRAAALKAQERAEAARGEADDQRATADKQRQLAESARQEADAQRAAALKAQERAEAARGEADDQRATADKQRQLAEGARQEADAQRAAAQTEQGLAEAAAREASARHLAAQSEYLRSSIGQLALTGLLAIESVQRLSILENRNAVAAALEVTGRERARLQYQGTVKAIAISPDGQWLATASDDHTARIWDAATGRERHRLKHQGSVFAVAISPDGKSLATASHDHTARIWDTSTGSIAKTAFETNTMFYDFHQVPYLKAFHNIMPS
jgi:hypothetical protein